MPSRSARAYWPFLALPDYAGGHVLKEEVSDQGGDSLVLGKKPAILGLRGPIRRTNHPKRDFRVLSCTGLPQSSP